MRRNAKKKKAFKSEMIFYVLVLCLPVLQFCVFYVGVNIKSILMSFQVFDGKNFVFVGLENFKQIYRDFVSSDMLVVALKNSLLVFLITIVMEFASLFFSFYIYKKYPFSNLFKFVLFFPSIVSGVVLGIIYLNISDVVIPQIVFDITGKEIVGLLGLQNTRFAGNIIFWAVFYFGMRVLVYTSSMSAIPNSVVEAAMLDGITPIDEFFKITLPLIFPSITSFLIFAVAGMFTNSIGTYSLYGVNAPNNVYTIGYFIMKETMMTTGLRDGYPYLAAFGMIVSLITIPIVLLTKHLVNKISDKVEG